MKLAPQLLEILACPWCLGALDERQDRLVCRRCRASYAVADGIPNMLVEEAELHCSKCGARLSVAQGLAVCEPCGLKWSVERRRTDLQDDPAPKS